MSVGLTHPNVTESGSRVTLDEYRMIASSTSPRQHLAETTVEVHRDPDPRTGAYRTRAVLPSGDTLAATSVPGLRINVADILR
jgi:hypothetical protein